MKFFFRIAFPAFAIILFIMNSCGTTDAGRSAVSPEDSLAALVKRGDYLVNNVSHCMHCHAEVDSTKFSSPPIPGTEGKGGEEVMPGIFVKNITPTALGSWTDAEIARALTEGIRKNGDTLFPVMPYRALSHLEKEDINSIVAYLRTLKPLPDSVPERSLAAFPPGLLSLAYEQYFLKHKNEKITTSSDKHVQRGSYLVWAANCMGCHSVLDMKELNYREGGWLAGGDTFTRRSKGYQVVTANITPDSATGIGTWTEAMFVAKFKNYRDPKSYSYNPGKNFSPMPWSMLSQMSDDDLKDIYAYLRTIEPVNNKVVKWPQ